MGKRIITWAGREKRRQTNKAVGGSFLKTLTELITNSDSAIKRQLGLSHAVGLVDEMLKLKPGDRVDTAELKKSVPKRREGKILVQVYSKHRGLLPSRTCQIIDYGPGMTEAELDRNFGDYAKAKAKGQRTRSLFGRGALDVFLYHSNQYREDGVDPSAHIFSVKGGTLSHCRIYWGRDSKGEEDSIIQTDALGPVTPSLLKKQSLPSDLTPSGTVVRFLLADGTRIPHEGNFLPSLNSFYMLRIIAADPSMHVVVQRFRSDGLIEERLMYDFDLGTVIKRSHDTFRHERLGDIPVDILVARSDRKMTYDPTNYERRENGLLFVDDDDAVLDLTLLPEYDKNPLLSRIYGLVRLSGIRSKLENLLEAQRPEAVLSETRDGFDMKNEIARELFRLVEKHVRPVYDDEEKRERKGAGSRSSELDRKLKEALRELNKFHNEETDEGRTGRPEPKDPVGPLSFSHDNVRLVAGQERRVTLYADRNRIHEELNVVELTSNNSRVQVVPESELVVRRKGSKFQAIQITLSCPVTDETAMIIATALGVDEQVLSTNLNVTDVSEPAQVVVPADLEFRPSRYNGKPSVENQLVLLVNLDAFPGLPLIRIRIKEREGAVTIGTERSEHIEIKTQKDWLMSGGNVAKVVFPYWGTAWGAKATIEAKAKRTDGRLGLSQCKVEFRQQQGPNQYEDVVYEAIERQILGEAAGKYVYVNSRPSLHQRLFGDSQETFDKALEDSSIAQMRVAGIVSDAVVYAVATTKYMKGGEKGLTIDESDPITAVREFVEAKRYELDAKLVRAFLKDNFGD